MRMSDWSSDVCSSDLTRARGLGAGAVGKGELLELGAVQAHQAGSERLFGMLAFGLHRPVFAGDECLDFFLAFDDQPQRRRTSNARRVGHACVSTCRSR